MGSVQSINKESKLLKNFLEIQRICESLTIIDQPLRDLLVDLESKASSLFKKYDALQSKSTMFGDQLELDEYLQSIEHASAVFLKSIRYIYDSRDSASYEQIKNFFYVDFTKFLNQVIQFAMTLDDNVTMQMTKQNIGSLSQLPLEIAIFNFSFHVEELTNFPFYEISLCPAYALRPQIISQRKNTFNILGPHGSGKSFLIPLFFLLRLMKSSKSFQFIIVVKPETSQIRDLLTQYDMICNGDDPDEKMYTITSSLPEILNIEENLLLPVIAILSPFDALRLFKEFSGRPLFLEKSTFIIDDLLTRTVEADILVQDISRTFINLPSGDKGGHLVFLSTISDRAYDNYLRITHNLTVTPERKNFVLKETKCKAMNSITNKMLYEMREFFNRWLDELNTVVGSVIVFAQNAKRGRFIIKTLNKIYRKQNGLNVVPIQVSIRPKETINSFYDRVLAEVALIQAERGEKVNTLCLLIFDLTDNITPEQMKIMKSKIPLPLMGRLSRVYVTTSKNESKLTIPDATVIFDSTVIELEYYDINKEVTTIKETLIPQTYCDQRAKLLNPMTSDTLYHRFYLEGVERPSFLPPALWRINLSQTLFTLRSINIELGKQKNLPTEPNHELCTACEERLKNMGILNEFGMLTEMGQLAVKYATVSPEFALATAHFNSKPEFAFLCSAVIEHSPNLIQDPQTELLCKSFCHFSDLVTLLQAIYEISDPDLEMDIENSGFIYGTLYAIYSMMGNTFNIENGQKLTFETLRWAANQEGGILAMADQFVSFLNPRFLEKRTAHFSRVIGAAPGSEPALVFNGNDIFKFDEDSQDSNILISRRPGWNGLNTPGDVIVLSLEIEESHKLNRGLLLHRDPKSLGAETANPGVASLEVTNPSLNSIFFVSLFEAYFSNEPITNNFVSIHHDTDTSATTFLIHMTKNNNRTYLNYCPRTAQVEEAVREAVGILGSLMPFVPKSVILKNDQPLCAVEILGTDTGNNYSNEVILFTDKDATNVIPYPLNQTTLKYTANNIGELRKTFSRVRFAITGESVYYKYVNGRQKEADLAYPNAYNALKSVFDDHYPSHLLLLVDKFFPNKPDVPALQWISTTARPPAETTTTNLNDLNTMVDATTSLMSTLGYSERGSNVFYIALNNGLPTVTDGEVPPEIAKLLNYNNGDHSIRCGLHTFVQTILSRYTKRKDDEDPQSIPIKQLSSTNHCTKYPSQDNKDAILNQINQALLNKFGLHGNDVQSLFLGNSLLVISIANLPPQLVAHPVSTNIWDDSYHRSNADQQIMSELSSLSVPATDIIELPSISITVLHMAHMKMTQDEFVEKVNSLAEEFGFLLVSRSEDYEVPTRKDDDELHGVLGQFSVEIAGYPAAILFASRVTAEFPALANDTDSMLGMTMTKTMATMAGGGAPVKILLNQSAQIIPVTLAGTFKEIVTRRIESGKRDWKFIPQTRLLIYPTKDANAVKSIMKGIRNQDNEVVCNYLCPDDPPIPLALNFYLYQGDGSVEEHGACHECLRLALINMEGIQMTIDPATHILDKNKIKDIYEPLGGISIFEPGNQAGDETWPVIPLGQILWTTMMCDPDDIGSYLKIWFTIIIDFTIRKNRSLFTFCPDHPDVVLVLAKSGNTSCRTCRKYLCSKCRQWHAPGECQEEFHLPPGFRVCPACKNVVEKSQACNHMSCRCGKHFCYYCGFGPTNDSGPIYSHLSEKHGSYYNDPPDYRKYCKGETIKDADLTTFYAEYPQFRPK